MRVDGDIVEEVTTQQYVLIKTVRLKFLSTRSTSVAGDMRSQSRDDNVEFLTYLVSCLDVIISFLNLKNRINIVH